MSKAGFADDDNVDTSAAGCRDVEDCEGERPLPPMRSTFRYIVVGGGVRGDNDRLNNEILVGRTLLFFVHGDRSYERLPAVLNKSSRVDQGKPCA